MRICNRSLLFASILLTGLAFGSTSETIITHFEGFGYEEGGIEYSAPGDIVHYIARITSIEFPQPDFPYYPETYEYTLVVTGLVSNGEMVNGNETMIIYNLGELAIYEDDSTASSWDEYPGFPDPPPSFTDGSLWLWGEFTDFIMLIYWDYGIGAFEGHVNLSGGSAMPWFSEPGYTFGGELFPPHIPNLPDGYDFSLDGNLLVEEPVATFKSSWSSVKAIY